MSAKAFFSYSPDMGVEFWEAASEARDSAQKEIDQYRKTARDDGEWPIDSGDVVWGAVAQYAAEQPVEVDGEDCVDFVLADVPDAAAPELLGALQSLLTAYQTVHGVGDLEMQPAIFFARKCIAAATGETA